MSTKYGDLKRELAIAVKRLDIHQALKISKEIEIYLKGERK